MKSPCIGNCSIKSSHCIGCARSRQEISDWMFYTNAQRQKIMDRLRHQALVKEKKDPTHTSK